MAARQPQASPTAPRVGSEAAMPAGKPLSIRASAVITSFPSNQSVIILTRKMLWITAPVPLTRRPAASPA